MQNTKPNLSIWLGGVLAIVLTVGYVVLLALKINVSSTYVVVLVAAVTHFLGGVVPNTTTSPVLSDILSVVKDLTGSSTSISTTTPTTKTTTTVTPLPKSSEVSSTT